MFTDSEKELLVDALAMALASNKRMQTSKPKFKEIFDKIHTDLTALQSKIMQLKTTAK